MKTYLILLLALISNDPRDIAKINSLKKEAERAYLNGDYELAAAKYSILSDSLELEDDQIKLNLAHSYFHLGDTTGAKLNYGKVGISSDRNLRSIAYQQLGVMSKQAKKYEEALQQLKSSIKADPTNREAVYDYEVVKKLLEEQKQQQQQDQQNQDQQNQDQQDQDQQDKDNENQEKQDQDKEGDQENKDEKGENQQEQDQEQKEGEQQEQEQQEGEQQEQEEEKSQEQMTKEKLQEMGISEEKARQLLEAMRQSEIKYLQNQKRKATKRPPSGKPDW